MNSLEHTKHDILSAFSFRHATKEFDHNKKISAADFDFILEVGRLSPSSFGFEPWKFIVVQNMELREQLKEYAWGAVKQLKSASHFVIILSRLPKDMAADSPYIQNMLNVVQQLPAEIAKEKRAVYDKFLKNDFALQSNERAMFEWACRQTYIALGNMMTAAAQIGIDSCPIEGFDKEALEQLLVKQGVMDNEHFGVACMVAFGSRLREPRTKTRKSADQVVEWIS
ncbi:NAD(P)H-dependent oxidoreductase [Paenibacillus filicis]|uniref:NAD(P)H-dependent oxidoreductase n=1 Tax=Paenibacillus filicis TaxID=669464 RepID=A0ABU9DJV0_9BACL